MNDSDATLSPVVVILVVSGLYARIRTDGLIGTEEFSIEQGEQVAFPFIQIISPWRLQRRMTPVHNTRADAQGSVDRTQNRRNPL